MEQVNTTANIDTRLPSRLTPHRNQPWQNWGQTARCRPGYSFFPRTAEDLSEVVQFASAEGKSVRAVGSGHSWSSLVVTDDILVYSQGLNAVTMDLSDLSHPRVVAGSGATVREINDVLEQHGYALPLNVVLESVRIGGLVATGSHGSGWNNRTLSDLVHAIEVVTASGRLRRFETGVDSEEVMNAARLNLGMFGLIYRVTLNVQKSWTVRARDRRLPIGQVLGDLQEMVLSHDNLDLFWWPFCDQFWVKTWQRSTEAATEKPRRNPADAVGSFVGAQFHNEMLRLAGWFPRLTPALSRVIFAATPSVGDKVVDVVEAIHYRRAIEVAKMGCVEVAFKVDADFSNVRWAIQRVIDQVKTYARRGKYPLNVVMNARFIHNSDCWLSPAYGEGHTCYIEVLSRTDPQSWRQFSNEIALDWLTLPQARPHWAKEYQHIPDVVSRIKTGYGQNIQKFNQLKAQLQVDPTNMFINPTLKEVFST